MKECKEHDSAIPNFMNSCNFLLHYYANLEVTLCTAYISADISYSQIATTVLMCKQVFYGNGAS